LADPDDPADAAARLEQALERIAALSAAKAEAAQADPSATEKPASSIDTNAVAARLDRLIERIRATLDHPPEG
jgi:hypothetical protein